MQFAKNKMASERAIVETNILEILTRVVDLNAYSILIVPLTSLASIKSAKTFVPEVVVKMLIVKS
jgi:hypothetical protein